MGRTGISFCNTQAELLRGGRFDRSRESELPWLPKPIYTSCVVPNGKGRHRVPRDIRSFRFWHGRFRRCAGPDHDRLCRWPLRQTQISIGSTPPPLSSARTVVDFCLSWPPSTSLTDPRRSGPRSAPRSPG